MHEHVTLERPDARDPTARGISSGFPTDLLSQSAARLRILALLYAFVFFMAGIFPALLFPGDRARFLGSFVQWGPSVIGIVAALLVAAAIRNVRLPLPTAMNIGLAFEIASSYAIAAAEFADPLGLEMHRGMIGLSWVAVWIVLFTVVVPTSPRRALVAALASVSSVPVVIGLMIASGATSFRLDPAQFFFGLVFPYLLVVGMAYVGARVVYHLGTEVKRARELGSYRLEERLGRGGMGEVWRARHRMLIRPAAIKVIRPALAGGSPSASEEAVRRFEREAQTIARLRSPHTVELYDFGIAADGAFYYVMELLDGLDADALVRRFGPIPAGRAIYLLQQVCHSLSEAESQRLVHRDIKPANIFLCRYGEDCDFVKVLDFGLAKAIGTSDATAEPPLTGENIVPGTPAFMAPEQALGKGDLDGRADIYATGCVAYWLLSGHLVFTADTPMELLLHHARTPPTPVSARTELPISPALDRVVLSCLAKDPANRPQSAHDLSRQLAEIDGADDWTQHQAREWWATHYPMRS
ncbi:MAG TPA: serine/threonine-protein kinase [Gemmatimonadales bacterium]|jgi:serine/threonine-protein kinase